MGLRKTIIILALCCLLETFRAHARQSVSLLNVSYDPTREFYQEVDTAFSKVWKEKTGNAVAVGLSNGGSGKQARSVIEGQQADVVTLALASDIDAIHDKADLLPADWQKRLPNNSCPYSSTIVFLERNGGRVHITNWDALARPGVSVIIPNPKTSGGARWIYLAAYGWSLRQNHGDHQLARKFVEQLFRNVPVMDEGARGSATTFVNRGIGDVLVAWENEALLVVNGFGKGKFEIVYPPESIRTEPPVAWVDKNVEAHGTRKVAEEYLRFLYTPEAQEMAARHYFRPSWESAAQSHAAMFPAVKMFTIEEMFGSWREAQKTHFDEGGIFDQIARSRR